MAEEAKVEPISKLKLIFLFLLGLSFMFALIFLPAGRFDWFEGWLYILLTLTIWKIMSRTVKRRHPELARYRMSKGEGTKKWDLVILAFFRLAVFLALIVAGFDAQRFQWSHMSALFWPLGFILHSVGFGGVIWAMATNRHFEGTVRIQKDREHRVIDTGPYHFVRHPGYVGLLLGMLGIPFLLRSWWALLPILAAWICIIVRTHLEDQTLSNELEGYREYTEKTRYRLIPLIW